MAVEINVIAKCHKCGNEFATVRIPATNDGIFNYTCDYCKAEIESAYLGKELKVEVKETKKKKGKKK